MIYENTHQNITYDCAAGVDGFLDLKLEAANEETVTFKGRNVRVVSEVNINCLDNLNSIIISVYHTHVNYALSFYSLEYVQLCYRFQQSLVEA